MLHGATEQENHDYSWAIHEAKEALEKYNLVEALRLIEHARNIEKVVIHRQSRVRNP
jgi:hypothetical protein